MPSWVADCSSNHVEQEDVIRFDHKGRTFAVYCSPDKEYFATEELCTMRRCISPMVSSWTTSSNPRDHGVILFHAREDCRLVALGGIGPGNPVARDIRWAEMLIARGATPSELASPAVKLKALLAA